MGGGQLTVNSEKNCREVEISRWGGRGEEGGQLTVNSERNCREVEICGSGGERGSIDSQLPKLTVYQQFLQILPKYSQILPKLTVDRPPGINSVRGNPSIDFMDPSHVDCHQPPPPHLQMSTSLSLLLIDPCVDPGTINRF